MDDKQMRPTWKNEFNLNTILMLISIAGILFGGGLAWQSVKSQQEANIKDINRLQSAVDSIKTDSREWSMYGYRITNLESGAASIAKAQRDLDRSMNELSSDIRVIRETVERLDKQSSNETWNRLKP